MTTRSVHTAVSGASHPFPKPSSLRAEDSHGRWYKNSRLVTIARQLHMGLENSAIKKPVMLLLQLAHLSKNSLNGRCLSIADRWMGQFFSLTLGTSTLSCNKYPSP